MLNRILSITRTTLNLDDDVFALARGLAEDHGVSLGKAVSFLARRGAEPRELGISPSGFFTFQVGPGAKPFGPKEVAEAQEGEYRDYARFFHRPGNQ